ncbi:MAG: FAD-binding oxidoreductase [Deltaproteobacteria bacterium]|jgi:FAD/FMN-containing dehydrogenase|nr:FAD-binding oxidoreductase [Deltaproteobacteria bacterium]MDD3618438.1 FAD-binding oxidoreductase [Desulfobulbaceae bacterium]
MSGILLKGLEGQEIRLKNQDISLFEAGLDGYLIVPANEKYNTARALWNGMIERKPGLIVRCRSSEDVMKCVDLARERGILLAVRGGGHNVAGNALCDGGLVIDLTEMRSVRVDADNALVLIDGGATLGEVDSATYPAHGLTTPMGVVTATGYAGLALHGGMGWQMRKYGLAADNIAGVDIVTADGRLLRAGPDENPDLYWAVRGGGGSFGVVTSFTSRLHSTPRQVMLAVPIFSLERAPEVLRFLRDYMVDAPDELMVLGAFWTAPDTPEIAPGNRGAHALFLMICFIGPLEDAEKAVAPLRNCQPVIGDLTSIKPWTEVQKFFDEDYPDGRRYYWKSTFADELTDPIIDALMEHAQSRPSMLTSIDLWSMGGAYGRVGAEETAFGSREAKVTINYESNWIDPGEDDANVEWTRKSLRQIQELAQSRTYLNFAGFGEDQERLVKENFGKNLDRLQQIKAAYDPHNLFRTNFNIRPKG